MDQAYFRQWRYAHRGLHDREKGIPENSMAAFKRAAANGFGAELDVHLMKDGHLAVIHDASLLRTAGVDVQIEDLTPLPSEEDPTDWKWEGYRLFEDRAGNRIATYTSTYARYAASEIPKGPVTLVGVLQYGNAGSIGKSYMIKMRDENDCFR